MKKSTILILTLLVLASYAEALTLPKLSIASNSCETDRSCCKSLPYGINKVCWRNDKKDWSNLVAYDVNNHWEDQVSDRQTMFQHYIAGSWQCEGPNDFVNSKNACAVFKYGNFRPSGFYIAGGSVSDMRWTPVKLMGAGECWSCGTSGTQWETEQYMDKWSVINRYELKFVKQGETIFSSQSIPDNAQWVTNIDGTYSGIRYTSTINGVSYEFIHVLSSKPTRYEHPSTSEWKAVFTGTAGQIMQVINIKAVSKVNGVSTGAEEAVSDWFTNYNSKADALKEVYENFMQGFKYPTGETNEHTQDYYNALFNHWYGTYQEPVTDTTSNFYVDGHNAVIPVPNILQYGDGVWPWDSAITTYGMMSSANTGIFANSQIKSRVSDLIKVQIKNQPKYPTTGDWLEIHAHSKGPAPQASELYIPVVLEAYKSGFISKEDYCASYLNFKAQYFAYKTKAGSDWLISQGSYFGRDGTDALEATSASPGATAGMALLAKGLTQIASDCGIAENYDADYANIKTAYESMWNENLGMYISLTSSGQQGAELSSLKTTPYDQFMGIIAGLVPKDRYQRMFNGLDQYFVSGGIGYTSIATTHSCFTAYGTNNGCVNGETWDGPIWNWVDGTYGLAAARVARIRDGVTISQEGKLKTWAYQLIGSDSPFGKESYNPSNLEADAEWDSVPYSPAGQEIPALIFDWNMVKHLSFTSTPAPVCVPAAEVCDGKDNSCDGIIDEGCSCVDGSTQACGVSAIGECKKGTQSCVSGQWSDCLGEVKLVMEVCEDSKDNDCDGTIDNGCPGYCEPVQQVCDPTDMSNYQDKSLNWMLNFVKTIIDFIIAKFAPA